MDDKKIAIQWNEKLSVGIPSIDAQHKILVEIVNNLFTQFYDESDNTVSVKTMSKLIVYINQHFKHEEELFEKYGWSGKNNHRNAHAMLTKKVLELKGNLDAEHDKDNSLKLMALLKTWLSEHIMVEDMQYAEFLCSKGAK